MNQQLYSISDDYNFLDTTMSIALVPVKDFDISEKYIIDGNIFIYPKHSLDTSILKSRYIIHRFAQNQGLLRT